MYGSPSKQRAKHANDSFLMQNITSFKCSNQSETVCVTIGERQNRGVTLSPPHSAADPWSTPVMYIPKAYSAPPRIIRPRERPSSKTKLTY